MRSSPREEKRAEKLTGDMERIGAQANDDGKGCHGLFPGGEENNADDWSSHKPDMRWANWNNPRGIQEYYTIQGKGIRSPETQETAHTWGTYMNPSEWQSVGRDILVGLPGTAPLEES
jgi:hypothetical protein